MKLSVDTEKTLLKLSALYKQILIFCFLFFTCSDLPYSPYDEAYTGDYRFNLQVNQDSLYPFIPYVFYYASGTDTFTCFSVHTDPPGVLDPFFFNWKKSSDSLGFYFTTPFTGTVRITGLRHNSRSDTFPFHFSIIDPCKIQYIQIISNPDSIRSFLLPGYHFFKEQIKNITWYLDTTVIDTLAANDSCAFPISRQKDLVLSACISDWQGHRFFTEPCTLLNRQLQLDIRVEEAVSRKTADSVFFSLIVRSHTGDSGNLTVESTFDTSVFPMFFNNTDTLLLSIYHNTSGLTGTLPVSVIYTNSEGITYKHHQLFTIGYDYRRSIINGVTFNPAVVYENQSVTLSVQAGLSPSGNRCNRFFWSFDGDLQWDTITGVPEIVKCFTGDSLHLKVCCSDSTGFTSNVYDVSLAVEPGLPEVNGITVIEPDIYTGKPFRIKIFAQDNPGGIIDSFRIKLSNLHGDTMVFGSDKCTLTVVVDTFFSGKVSLQAQVSDRSNHWSKPFIMQDTLIISRGYPDIVSMYFIDTVWINQQALLFLQTEDNDGMICKTIINWGDSSSDTIINNKSSISQIIRHTFNVPGGKLNTVKVTVTDDNNQVTTDSIRINIHEGKPLVQAITSPICVRENDILYVKSDQLSSSQASVFEGTISFSMSSYDSNGVVIKHFCDIDSPFSTIGAIGFSNSNLMSFALSDSLLFTRKHPLVKSVLYAMDNDGFLGSDTFFITLDYAPEDEIAVLLPSPGDTLRSSVINYIWTGGMDAIDSLETRFTLVVRYHYDQFQSIYKDSLIYKGKLGDFLDPASLSCQFKITINSYLGNNLEDITPVTFTLTATDRLNQSITHHLGCYEQ